MATHKPGVMCIVRGHVGGKLIATMEQQYLVPIDEPGLNTEGDTGAKKPDAVLA